MWPQLVSREDYVVSSFLFSSGPRPAAWWVMSPQLIWKHPRRMPMVIPNLVKLTTKMTHPRKGKVEWTSRGTIHRSQSLGRKDRESFYSKAESYWRGEPSAASKSMPHWHRLLSSSHVYKEAVDVGDGWKCERYRWTGNSVQFLVSVAQEGLCSPI